MKWMKLELRKASNLRKEVDEAIRNLSAAIQRGDYEQIEMYRAAFSERIDELEEFYLHHDDDERAVLFEKQRLRLRRALQATNQAAAAMSREGTMTASPKKEGENAPPMQNEVPDTPVDAGAMAVEDLGTPTPAKSALYRQTAQKSTPVPGGRSTPSKGQGSRSSSVSSSTKKKKKAKALYDWEKRDGDEEQGAAVMERMPIETSYGMFVPSHNIAGFYEQQQALSVSQQYVDFQVILSEADFQKLAARRRSKKKIEETIKKDSKESDSPYLFSSMPYVDPQRVERGLYRDRM
mmetsp:Transcript_41866/g.111535  ORF Transcript_41866/g.111535 Transcript_41866/m.111535 type:complete len:293 (+) Transcript_41866:102-980(+)|eukprot:CAMPEP_0119503356 /NCGR_PEP_ID=MMETSP1344-20130328/24550_1 /TAXON_ID=236787 /ORGANISM="Florenciella parvula, Strain CCMP2471" /LENGTH=292 /DNA_ID=CAMNT_0007539639 /DNA_START=86 /DNA_END=964 /DNA_ORIENTATION=-